MMLVTAISLVGVALAAYWVGKQDANQMESRLRVSEETYRNFFYNAQVGLFRSCLDKGAILEANHQIAHMFGYADREEFITEFVAKDHYVDPAHRQRMLQVLGEAGEIRNYEAQFRQQDGSVVWMRFSARLCACKGCLEGVIENITARVQAEERLRYLSYHDTLTGLYNRAFIEEELERRANDKDITVIIGDVNGLKLTNDAFGHDHGDQLLIRMASVLRRACGQDCIVGRWGGDEFVIVLPDSRAEGANEIMQAIQQACLAEQCGSLRPSISLGMATRRRCDEPLNEVIGRAEERMYRQKLVEGRSIRSAIIASLTNTLRERSFETEEHAERTRQLATALGQRLGLSANRLAALSLMATLHDIGKIMIPDHIFVKPELTAEDWEIVKKHPEVGYRITQASPDLALISEGILAHHEWWDGSGYPRGIKGEDIPLIARIIALVDAYDVMVYGRPYQTVMTKEEALVELRRSAGVQFDPHLVDVFVEMLAERVPEIGKAALDLGG